MHSAQNQLSRRLQETPIEQRPSDATDDIEPIVLAVWDLALERRPPARKASIPDIKVGLLRAHRRLAEIARATGVVMLITALFKLNTVDRLLAAWDVRRFSGDHSGMLREPHVQGLARQISDCLAELDAKSQHHQRRPHG